MKNLLNISYLSLARGIACILLLGAWAQPSQASSVPLAIENFVDRNSPAYREFVEVKKIVDRLNTSITGNQLCGRDPVTFVERKSQTEAEYVQLLQSRASSFYYRGDDFWYYRAIKNPHDLNLMNADPLLGPMYCRLNNGSLMSSLPLKNPFVHLLSFNQIENICGFAALANAKALETQMATGRQITFAETRRLAEANIEIVRPVMEELTGNILNAGQERLARASTRLNFEDEGNIEYLDKRAVEDLHKQLKKGTHKERNGELEKKIALLDKVHIVYNVGGAHWVLLSVLKVQPGRVTMYLLNSSNAPLAPQDDVALLVSYIDDVIERGVHLGRALEAPDIKTFNAVITSPLVSKGLLLEELVKAYLIAGDGQKDQLCKKIDAVSVLVDVSALPKDLRDFFVRKQTEYQDLVWPKNFTAFTAKCEAKSMNKPTPPVAPLVTDVKKNNDRYFMPFVVGISVCGLALWLKSRAPQKDDANGTPKTAAA